MDSLHKRIVKGEVGGEDSMIEEEEVEEGMDEEEIKRRRKSLRSGEGLLGARRP
ncbi:MAG: hypothetical protein OD814_001710 [Candidatus Alkanophagales archaeon MCA70_species_1]|nr:hypothetical protein [Candidatus Alkanophaga volatiphilum]